MVCRSEAPGSTRWLQCTTTSSPTFQPVTPSPMDHTTPDASEPAMWKSRPCALRMLTGSPRPAQMPLKFTPAAMTCTRTSPGPAFQTGISSCTNDFFGSPKRSGRMTKACIFSGTLPNSGTLPTGTIWGRSLMVNTSCRGCTGGSRVRVMGWSALVAVLYSFTRRRTLPLCVTYGVGWSSRCRWLVAKPLGASHLMLGSRA
jgi:hypothetical protein